ncbi:hypothetical protein ACVIGB_001925 [Bradyrhizobium sp. USDA 4341]
MHNQQRIAAQDREQAIAVTELGEGHTALIGVRDDQTQQKSRPKAAALSAEA